MGEGEGGKGGGQRRRGREGRKRSVSLEEVFYLYLYLYFLFQMRGGGEGGRRKGDKKMRKYFVLQSTKSIDKMYKILTGLRASKEDRRFQG